MATTRSRRSAPPRPAPAKYLTGIPGFDQVAHGGLLRGRSTLLLGGPGSGKTVFALQTLAYGARVLGEPGILVSCEEDPAHLVANAASFGWDLPALQRRSVYVLDARPSTDLIRAGEFDLLGMLAAIELKAKRLGARRIVFDSLDIILALLPDPLSVRREVQRLHRWLSERDFSALITAKTRDGGFDLPDSVSGGFLQFMVDCVIELGQRMDRGVALRNLRILKYRSSTFAENEAPFVIGAHGLEVAGERTWPAPSSSDERVSSGVARLDAMLRGGYFRGASILITGAPGTAKSTLAGAFAEAACARGERTLFLSYDSAASEVIKDLLSVNVRLRRFVRRGILSVFGVHGSEGSAEVQFERIRKMVRHQNVRCVVIDPVSALGKQNRGGASVSVVERLIQWAKSQGVTLLSTSFTLSANPELTGTPVQISTIADTWLHLSYGARGGERNRTLTIIKSRGTAHSNQVRELLLSDAGVTLADVYVAGGDVLMGTARWEQEEVARAEEARSDATRHGLEHDKALRAEKQQGTRERRQADPGSTRRPHGR